MFVHDRLKPRKLPRQGRSRHTADIILAATARVLLDEGYDRASTDRIAKVAGISVGSLYSWNKAQDRRARSSGERSCRGSRPGSEAERTDDAGRTATGSRRASASLSARASR
ncbi:MAG: helix-turn-helix transcriptional regulator [Deltaproteobacteria bacterium]|nr:helix-turn-helix transcriptional regulator [Deltaproteobacteria bacterium]